MSEYVEKFAEKPRVRYTYSIVGNKRRPARIREREGCAAGDILSTSEGPHKVVGIYWTGDAKRGWVGDVLLMPADKKDRKKQKYAKAYGKKRSR